MPPCRKSNTSHRTADVRGRAARDIRAGLDDGLGCASARCSGALQRSALLAPLALRRAGVPSLRAELRATAANAERRACQVVRARRVAFREPNATHCVQLIVEDAGGYVRALSLLYERELPLRRALPEHPRSTPPPLTPLRVPSLELAPIRAWDSVASVVGLAGAVRGVSRVLSRSTRPRGRRRYRRAQRAKQSAEQHSCRLRTLPPAPRPNRSAAAADAARPEHAQRHGAAITSCGGACRAPPEVRG